MGKHYILIFLAAAVAATTGARAGAIPAHLEICSGYGCYFRTRLSVTESLRRELTAIMRAGQNSATAERAAISRAVQYFERQVTKTIGVADRAKAAIGDARTLGQMDCIDESTNTRRLLDLLAAMGALRHHVVERNASRGIFLDQRYPHQTAVVRERSGTRWVVDSWYEPAGGPPDIMPLEEWRSRGVRGQR
jgi:hypothetical protein